MVRLGSVFGFWFGVVRFDLEPLGMVLVRVRWRGLVSIGFVPGSLLLGR